MIKCAGATKDTNEKINFHCADFDLFAGLNGCIRAAKCSLILAVHVHHPVEADGEHVPHQTAPAGMN